MVQILLDTFSLVGTDLADHTPDVGSVYTAVSGTMRFDAANRVYATTANTLYTCPASSANYYAEMEITCLTALSAQNIGIAVRCVDVNNMYLVRYNRATAEWALIVVKTSGGNVVADTIPDPGFIAGVTRTVRITIAGTMLSASIGGIGTLGPHTTTAFAAAGKIAIRNAGAAATATTGYHIKGLRAETVSLPVEGPADPQFDYYISPTGSDSNPGTQAAPWAITAINTKRALYAPAGQPGKTLGLMDGTYAVGELYAVDDYNVPVLDLAGTTHATPVTLRAVNPRAAIIDSELATAGTRPVLGNSTAVVQGGIVVDGIVFTRSVSRCVKFGDYSQSPVTRTVRLQNCEFRNNDARTTPVSGGNNSQLEISNQRAFTASNNYFHDNIGESATSNDHHSAILAWKCKDSVFEYNTVIRSGSVFGKAEGHSGNVFRYNYLELSHINDNTPALQDWNGDNSPPDGSGTGSADVIHNNILKGASGADLRNSYYGSQFTRHRVRFFNNTVHMIAQGNTTFGLAVRTGSGGLDHYGNIYFNQTTAGDQGFVAINVNSNGVHDYNCYYKASGSQWQTYANESATMRNGVSSLASYRTAVGGDANSIVSSPSFVATGVRADWYKLSAGSPCIGASRTGGAPTDPACDMGAWGGATPPTRIGCDF